MGQSSAVAPALTPWWALHTPGLCPCHAGLHMLSPACLAFAHAAVPAQNTLPSPWSGVHPRHDSSSFKPHFRCTTYLTFCAPSYPCSEVPLFWFPVNSYNFTNYSTSHTVLSLPVDLLVTIIWHKSLKPKLSSERWAPCSKDFPH